MSDVIVSRHFLRRRARAAAARRNREARAAGLSRNVHYKVERADRGPYRWFVRR